MKKYGVFILGLAVLAALVVQLRTASNLRLELTAARAENESLRHEVAVDAVTGAAEGKSRASLNAKENNTEAVANRLQELESEVLRLRGVAARALRAEADVAQLQTRLNGRQPQSNTPGTEVGDSGFGSSSNLFLSYLGDAVAPPANIDPDYSKEGLTKAIERAAELAGVSLKKVRIENSEFPFLAGVVCESDTEFEKLKEQFKTMNSYQYSGATSSHGVYAFNIIPYRAYPSDAGQRIGRRTLIRQQMFFDQLNSNPE